MTNISKDWKTQGDINFAAYGQDTAEAYRG